MDSHQENLGIDNFYWELNSAIEELTKRRTDTKYVNSINEQLYITEDLKILTDRVNLVLFRQVATPIHEVMRILKISKEIGIPLIIVEFGQDKFTPSVNEYKYNLINLPIYNLSKSKTAVSRVQVGDISKMEGRMIKDVTTANNESIRDLHHHLLKETVNGKYDYTILDLSNWFKSFGGARKYYYDFFKFFIAHNILCEVYLTEGNENDFTNSVIKPILTQISSDMSKPLIWNYLDGTAKKHKYFWDFYPSEVGDILSKKGYRLVDGSS
jgi:hypothetical protein